ncbi:MAG: hypothetical protein M1818_004434 [Claussenomyces sp. TS43310]|nr:MAG: hypothetical protein M1818_004434 [Claussenomyces sp. TS43310]
MEGTMQPPPLPSPGRFRIRVWIYRPESMRSSTPEPEKRMLVARGASLPLPDLTVQEFCNEILKRYTCMFQHDPLFKIDKSQDANDSDLYLQDRVGDLFEDNDIFKIVQGSSIRDSLRPDVRRSMSYSGFTGLAAARGSSLRIDNPLNGDRHYAIPHVQSRFRREGTQVVTTLDPDHPIRSRERDTPLSGICQSRRTNIEIVEAPEMQGLRVGERDTGMMTKLTQIESIPSSDAQEPPPLIGAVEPSIADDTVLDTRPSSPPTWAPSPQYPPAQTISPSPHSSSRDRTFSNSTDMQPLKPTWLVPGGSTMPHLYQPGSASTAATTPNSSPPGTFADHSSPKRKLKRPSESRGKKRKVPASYAYDDFEGDDRATILTPKKPRLLPPIKTEYSSPSKSSSKSAAQASFWDSSGFDSQRKLPNAKGLHEVGGRRNVGHQPFSSLACDEAATKRRDCLESQDVQGTGLIKETDRLESTTGGQARIEKVAVESDHSTQGTVTDPEHQAGLEQQTAALKTNSVAASTRKAKDNAKKDIATQPESEVRGNAARNAKVDFVPSRPAVPNIGRHDHSLTGTKELNDTPVQRRTIPPVTRSCTPFIPHGKSIELTNIPQVDSPPNTPASRESLSSASNSKRKLQSAKVQPASHVSPASNPRTSLRNFNNPPKQTRLVPLRDTSSSQTISSKPAKKPAKKPVKKPVEKPVVESEQTQFSHQTSSNTVKDSGGKNSSLDDNSLDDCNSLDDYDSLDDDDDDDNVNDHEVKRLVTKQASRVLQSKSNSLPPQNKLESNAKQLAQIRRSVSGQQDAQNTSSVEIKSKSHEAGNDRVPSGRFHKEDSHSAVDNGLSEDDSDHSDKDSSLPSVTRDVFDQEESQLQKPIMDDNGYSSSTGLEQNINTQEQLDGQLLGPITLARKSGDKVLPLISPSKHQGGLHSLRQMVEEILKRKDVMTVPPKPNQNSSVNLNETASRQKKSWQEYSSTEESNSDVDSDDALSVVITANKGGGKRTEKEDMEMARQVLSDDIDRFGFNLTQNKQSSAGARGGMTDFDFLRRRFNIAKTNRSRL